MARFDDVVNKLKSVISNEEKKEEAKAKHEENIIHEKMFRRRMQERGAEDPEDEVKDEV